MAAQARRPSTVGRNPRVPATGPESTGRLRVKVPVTTNSLPARSAQGKTGSYDRTDPSDGDGAANTLS